MLVFSAIASTARPGGLILTVDVSSGSSTLYLSAEEARELIATLQQGIEKAESHATPAEAAA